MSTRACFIFTLFICGLFCLVTSIFIYSFTEDVKDNGVTSELKFKFNTYADKLFILGYVLPGAALLLTGLFCILH